MKCLQCSAKSSNGWPVKYRPEALALAFEALALAPFADRRQHVLERIVALVAAEQHRLPGCLRVHGSLGRLQRVRNAVHERRAVCAERIEATGLDECLEHAAVDLL